jgi:sugar phosphate isomerase/epimerase
MQLGLVTYMWGADWDLPTIIKNLQLTGFAGVELRTGHKHGVDLQLDESQRQAIAKQFAGSGVKLVGLGTACEYHSPDPAVLKKNIEDTKAYVQLCHDCGGSGVKVRPNGLPADVPVEQTLQQIGRALQEIGEYAEGYGVQIRLEVHGKGTQELPNIKRIMDAAPCRNVAVCWNCNPTDTDGGGLEKNFDLVRDRLGTIHIHDLVSSYPWPQLFKLLKGAQFDGWTLLEEGSPTSDPIRVMKYYKQLWQRLIDAS